MEPLGLRTPARRESAAAFDQLGPLLRSPEIEQPDKTFFWFVWECVCERQAKSVVLWHSVLAYELGVSPTSIVRYIDALVEVGVFERNQNTTKWDGKALKRERGRTHVYVRQPADVIGRPGTVTDDGQVDLFSRVARDEAADDAPGGQEASVDDATSPSAKEGSGSPRLIPAGVIGRPSTHSEAGQSADPPRIRGESGTHSAAPILSLGKKISTGVSVSEVSDVETHPRLNRGRSNDSATHSGPVPVAAALVGAMGRIADRLLDPSAQHEEIERCIAWQRRMVGPTLRIAPALKVAKQIVVLGGIERADATRIYGQAVARQKAGTLSGTLGSYYAGTMKLLFADREVPWE